MSHIEVNFGFGQSYLYALPPDEHRDFPSDTLASDGTCRITAWAVNNDGAVIGPVAALRVRSVDARLPAVTQMQDYLDTATIPVTNHHITEFTVLK